MPEAIPPEGAFWDQEGAFYGQDNLVFTLCAKSGII
jgi:hypothetical protein